MLQAQGKQKQALEVVEGKMGDVISMAAERRSLRASLHVCSWHLYLLPPSVILPCTPDACAVEAKAPVFKRWTQLRFTLYLILHLPVSSTDGCLARYIIEAVVLELSCQMTYELCLSMFLLSKLCLRCFPQADAMQAPLRLAVSPQNKLLQPLTNSS